ncbi:hypothetical protein FGO68_gene4861 [Halteria grandinella]|uniref:Uncharacterized protein n=1 Tax=Halteria grandinella TaxID=5974 RepID=A0A8J8SWR3_HALGN|nr:hypothetical protein FGO68_gene4861 [Halteria grandinella]
MPPPRKKEDASNKKIKDFASHYYTSEQAQEAAMPAKVGKSIFNGKEMSYKVEFTKKDQSTVNSKLKFGEFDNAFDSSAKGQFVGGSGFQIKPWQKNKEEDKDEYPCEDEVRTLLTVTFFRKWNSNRESSIILKFQMTKTPSSSL